MTSINIKVKRWNETNIKNMRTFYEEWSPILNWQPLAADMDNLLIVTELPNRQPLAADLTADDFECFMNIGFTHHREIIRKTQTLDERLFYIRRCAKEFWSKVTLKYHLNENLYAKQGSIQQTNFNKTIENALFKQKALQSFKDEYLLDSKCQECHHGFWLRFCLYGQPVQA